MMYVSIMFISIDLNPNGKLGRVFDCLCVFWCNVMHVCVYVWMHESSPPLLLIISVIFIRTENSDAHFETFCLFFSYVYISLSIYMYLRMLHVCIVKTFKYMYVVLCMYVLCMSLYMYVHVYSCNDMYVKQDHHHLYLHSLSFIICFIHNIS